MPRGAPKTIDVAEWFSPEMIGAALAGIYTMDGAHLEPYYDNRGVGAVCPISLQPIESPALLGDGTCTVYEENQILQWVRSSNRAPSTNLPLSHKNVLRLKPVKTALEGFLQRSGSDSRPSLARCLREAIASTARPEARVRELEAQIALAVGQAEELNEIISRAVNALSNLREEIETSRLLAASRLRAAARSLEARQRLMSLAQVEHCEQRRSQTHRAPPQMLLRPPGLWMMAMTMTGPPTSTSPGLVSLLDNAAPLLAVQHRATVTPETPVLYQWQPFACQYRVGFPCAPFSVGAARHDQQGFSNPSSTRSDSGRSSAATTYSSASMAGHDQQDFSNSNSISNDSRRSSTTYHYSRVGVAGQDQQGFSNPNIISNDSRRSSTVSNHSAATESLTWYTNPDHASRAQAGQRMPVRNAGLRAAGSGYNDEAWVALGDLRLQAMGSDVSAQPFPGQH